MGEFYGIDHRRRFRPLAARTSIKANILANTARLIYYLFDTFGAIAMNRGDFFEIMTLYRIRLDGTVRELSNQWEFEAMAETLSPDNIIKSYAMGMDGIQNEFRGRRLSNFDRAGGKFVDWMNSWAANAKPLHYDYIRACHNPDFKIKFGDVMKLIEYSSGVTFTKVLVDLFKQTASGLVAASPDIKKMARYLTTVHEFDDAAMPYIGEHLWAAFRADL